MNPATLEVEQAVVPKHLQSPCLRKIPCNVVGTVVDEWVDGLGSLRCRERSSFESLLPEPWRRSHDSQKTMNDVSTTTLHGDATVKCQDAAESQHIVNTV